MSALPKLTPDAPAVMPVDRVTATLLLATWLSPAFPVGGFSYSHGLETAIVAGGVADAAQLADWVELLIERGSAWNDALLMADAWRAVSMGDRQRLEAIVELGSALAISRERHIETTAMGEAFLKAIAAGWPAPIVASLGGRLVAYPIAVGAVTAGHGLPLDVTLAAYLNTFAATLVSVAVRLVPLGQTDGLRVLSGLQRLVLATAERAEATTLDDLGSAAVISDIAALRHEVLYSRVFRT